MSSDVLKILGSVVLGCNLSKCRHEVCGSKKFKIIRSENKLNVDSAYHSNAVTYLFMK